MANGEQMKIVIKEATEKVALKGCCGDDVTDRDVTLAGFGYLVDEFKKAIDSLKPEPPVANLSWVKCFGIPAGVFTGLGAGIGVLGKFASWW